MSGMITRASLRAFSTEALKVTNNVTKQQFVVAVRDAEAVIIYEKSGKQITFIEANVPEQFQGKGVGKLLAKYAFDHAHTNKLSVLCKCPFLAKYYEINKKNYQGLSVKFDLEEHETKKK